jgi:hypothetical protein
MSQILKDVTIPPGQTRSDEIFIGTSAVIGFHQKYPLETPAAIHFQARTQDGSWKTLEQNGAPVQLRSGQQLTSIDPALTRAFSCVRVVTGTPDSEVVVSATQGTFQLLIDQVAGGGTSSLNLPLIKTVTISAGLAQSERIEYWGYVPVAVAMPAAWTAAPLSFLVQVQPGSTSAAQRLSLYDDSGEYIIPTADANRHIAINHCLFLGMAFLAVRSGTESSPVAQTSARTLVLVLRKVD